MKDAIEHKLQNIKENKNLRELAEEFLHEGYSRNEIEKQFNELLKKYHDLSEIKYNAILDTLDYIVGYCSEETIIKLKAGTKVILKSTNEKGVIVHGWFDSEMLAVDYYIVFFGDEFPLGKPKEKYILRYLETSISVLK